MFILIKIKTKKNLFNAYNIDQKINLDFMKAKNWLLSTLKRTARQLEKNMLNSLKYFAFDIDLSLAALLLLPKLMDLKLSK